jgi:hypothetical protein
MTTQITDTTIGKVYNVPEFIKEQCSILPKTWTLKISPDEIELAFEDEYDSFDYTIIDPSKFTLSFPNSLPEDRIQQAFDIEYTKFQQIPDQWEEHEKPDVDKFSAMYGIEQVAQRLGIKEIKDDFESTNIPL